MALGPRPPSTGRATTTSGRPLDPATDRGSAPTIVTVGFDPDMLAVAARADAFCGRALSLSWRSPPGGPLWD